MSVLLAGCTSGNVSKDSKNLTAGIVKEEAPIPDISNPAYAEINPREEMT